MSELCQRASRPDATGMRSHSGKSLLHLHLHIRLHRLYHRRHLRRMCRFLVALPAPSPRHPKVRMELPRAVATGEKRTVPSTNPEGAFWKYFCNVCKLWDNSESKSIYHCPYCNVCRVGRGLGIDYRHCMACNCCVEMRKGAKHRCISQVLEGTCPICAEELRTSTTPLKGLPCGHTLHLSCYKQYRRYKYTCPVCLKSMDDMREYFGRLDQASAASRRPGPTYSTFAHS